MLHIDLYILIWLCHTENYFPLYLFRNSKAKLLFICDYEVYKLCVCERYEPHTLMISCYIRKPTWSILLCKLYAHLFTFLSNTDCESLSRLHKKCTYISFTSKTNHMLILFILKHTLNVWFLIWSMWCCEVTILYYCDVTVASRDIIMPLLHLQFPCNRGHQQFVFYS
jgi:hypothetical protein